MRAVGAVDVAEEGRAQLRLSVGLDAPRARLFRGRAENIAAAAAGWFQHPEIKDERRNEMDESERFKN